jgi:long-chain acyl-CoA synthetase
MGSRPQSGPPGEVSGGAGAFWARAARDPRRIALVDDAGHELTAGDLLADANRIANGLRGLGLRPGDRVAVVMTNSAAFVRVYLGTAQAGLYLVTVNYHLTAEEMAYILEDSSARAVICVERVAPVVADAARAAGVDPARIFVDGDVVGTRPLAEFLEEQSADVPAQRPAGGVMQYTSGTTGRPKGVLRPLPHGDADEAYERSRIQWVYDAAGLTDVFDRWLVAAPLYHSANLLPATGTLHAGGLLVLMDGWTPELFLEQVSRYRITGTHLVPTHFHRLLRIPEAQRPRHDTSSLRVVLHGAAPCPVEVKLRMLEWFGPVLYEYYGSTEVGSTFATPAEWLAHPGTVGRALPPLRLKVLDASGREVPTGDVGTVYMHLDGDRTEYLGDADKTAAARRGDLITVGDQGYLDADGFLYLVGRVAELIIVGGVNVYPAEIEAVLSQHPAVDDVGVTGMSDPDLGEVPVAYLVLEPGADADRVRKELAAECGARLATVKHPRRFVILEELPRDPTGKLRKHRLPVAIRDAGSASPSLSRRHSTS